MFRSYHYEGSVNYCRLCEKCRGILSSRNLFLAFSSISVSVVMGASRGARARACPVVGDSAIRNGRILPRTSEARARSDNLIPSVAAGALIDRAPSFVVPPSLNSFCLSHHDYGKCYKVSAACRYVGMCTGMYCKMGSHFPLLSGTESLFKVSKLPSIFCTQGVGRGSRATSGYMKNMYIVLQCLQHTRRDNAPRRVSLAPSPVALAQAVL